MDTVEYWVLDDGDRALVERLAAGLGRDAARVLAYLLLRRDHDRIEPSRATSMAIRIGTGLNGKAVDDALSRLEARGLVERASGESTGPGRPPNAWRPELDRRGTVDRAHRTHSNALLGRAAAIAGVPSEQTDDTGSGGGAGERDRATDIALNW
ncbi:MAG: myristoyl transferase, partial [Natrialbaceae archaeon]